MSKMKVSIPGRAIKMQEYHPTGVSQLNSPLLQPRNLTVTTVEIRPGKGFSKGAFKPQITHQGEVGQHNNNREWKRTAKLYKRELKAKGNIRPSTAVRRHVKKISEEFAMTQTKYEKSVSLSGSAKSSEEKNHSPKLSSSALTSSSSTVNNSKIPQSKFPKNVLSKITCSKCESITRASRKSLLVPSINSSSVSGSNNTSTATTSVATKNIPILKCQNHKGKTISTIRPSSTTSPKHVRDSPQKKLPGSATSPTVSSPQPKLRNLSARCGGNSSNDFGLAPTSPCQMRSPSRRGSALSSLHGVSPRSHQLTPEHIKKAKMFIERAIMEGRVFSIFGYFPAIKEALRQRGWVEKMQHTVPYVNPHPQNCVCPHVGYQASLIAAYNAQNQAQATNQTQSASGQLNSEQPTTSSPGADEETACDESSTSPTTQSLSEEKKCDNQEEEAEEEKEEEEEEVGGDATRLSGEGEESCQPEQFVSMDSSTKQQGTNIASPAAISDSLSSCSLALNIQQSSSSSASLSPSLELSGVQQSENTANLGSSTTKITVPTEIATSENNSPSKKETLQIPDSAQSTDKSPSASDENSSSDQLKFLDKRDSINTAILGPSEIRKGLAESITEKNADIFKYSTIHIPKKSKSYNDETEEEETDKLSSNDTENHDDAQETEEEREASETEAEETEMASPPEPPNPYIGYELCEQDLPLVARLVRNVEPNFLWTWTRDSIAFKHLSREQTVNRFPNTPFTTKYGLCETLQQLHWFSEAACVDTFVPRGYCIGHEDERTAFIHDYRTTACLNVLKWVVERHDTMGPQAVADPHGEVAMKRVRQALAHVEHYIQSCCHDDLDAPPPPSFREHEWDSLLSAHYRIVHMDKKIKVPSQSQLQTLVSDCESALKRVVPYWPQLSMDGLRNLWIVKPGAQSRGRGIFLMNHLEDILALVQSPLIYETKYVVQKYMERPLLIHNTKFDIRQWFLVTDWNPLHVWVYKECYLRFCSQQFDLTNNNEAIHLSNNAIQCKYLNGVRSQDLPEENMWDCHQFKDYLRGVKKERCWDEVVYPGMRDALVAAMLAAQVEMDSFKHGFELFGADFMLTEDLRPWLIEINSSPCMAATTSVTRRMCAQCLHDVIKVVVDYKQNKAADTGLFELAYRDSERSIPNPPYLGVNLQVVGRQIRKGPLKVEKRKPKKAKPVVRVVKPLPLITLSLEDNPHYTTKDTQQPKNNPNPLMRHCSLLDCRQYGSSTPLSGDKNDTSRQMLVSHDGSPQPDHHSSDSAVARDTSCLSKSDSTEEKSNSSIGTLTRADTSTRVEAATRAIAAQFGTRGS